MGTCGWGIQYSSWAWNRGVTRPLHLDTEADAQPVLTQGWTEALDGTRGTHDPKDLAVSNR